MKNYYHILHIDYNASSSDIKSSYRQLAKQYHPDVNAGSRSKEDMFKLVGEAYQVLSDEGKRASYDLSLLLHLNGQTNSTQTNTWDMRQSAYRRRPFYQRYSPVVYSRRTHLAMAVLLLTITAAVLFVPLSLTRYSSEYHYDKGLEYFQNGQYYAALNSLERSVIDFGTKDVEACLLAGNILMRKYGQYNYAIEYADKGLERASSKGEQVQLLYLKGQCLKKRTDYHAALKVFEQALLLWPEYDSLYYAVGEIYAFHLDEYALGVKSFDRLLKVNRNFREGLYGQAYCYYKLNDYNTALLSADEYLQGGVTNAQAHLLKGKILLHLGQLSQACDLWQRAAALDYGEAEHLIKSYCEITEDKFQMTSTE